MSTVAAVVTIEPLFQDGDGEWEVRTVNSRWEVRRQNGQWSVRRVEGKRPLTRYSSNDWQDAADVRWLHGGLLFAWTDTEGTVTSEVQEVIAVGLGVRA